MSKILSKELLTKLAPNLSKEDRNSFLTSFAKEDTREMFAATITECPTQENDNRYRNNGRSIPKDGVNSKLGGAFLGLCNCDIDTLRYIHKNFKPV